MPKAVAATARHERAAQIVKVTRSRKNELPEELVWANRRDQATKGKHYSTEKKIRILREAAAGKSIVDVEVTRGG